MADTPCAYEIARAGSWHGAADTVTLDYEARFLRRKRLTTESGAAFRVDLPETVSLAAGDAFRLEHGRFIEVAAAPETLLQVTGPELTRLAWHIGNRHTPCQVEVGRLLIQHDHVLADMLARLGATVTHVTEPFTPEGGAYGHGRTMGHAHGPDDHGHHHHPHSE